jgi:Zn-finger nucleic acid-binding protein
VRHFISTKKRNTLNKQPQDFIFKLCELDGLSVVNQWTAHAIQFPYRHTNQGLSALPLPMQAPSGLCGHLLSTEARQQQRRRPHCRCRICPRCAGISKLRGDLSQPFLNMSQSDMLTLPNNKKDKVQNKTDTLDPLPLSSDVISFCKLVAQPPVSLPFLSLSPLFIPQPCPACMFIWLTKMNFITPPPLTHTHTQMGLFICR